MSLIDDGFALITSQGRQIASLIPDVVIREVNRDEMVITDHPVEKGVAISDHAFIRPLEVEMIVGWSDSTAGQIGYVREVYQELVSLQQERQPFSLSTGKRNYQNMLLGSLAVQTDEHSEHTLMVTARFREVNIVETQTTGAPKSAQASPEKTGSTSDKGQQQMKSVGTSGFASPSARQ